MRSNQKQPLKRRTDAFVKTQQIFDQVVYSPVDWPWKTVRLERESLLDYRQRSVSARVSIAELYHENSKLYPHILSQLTVSRLDAAGLRREFLRRRAAVWRDQDHSEDIVTRSCRQLITAVTQRTDPQLFYAVELRVLSHGLVATHEPVADKLQVVREISSSDVAVLRSALQAVSDEGERSEADSIIFIVGHFARNDLMFGPRGYRRTLLEAGRISEEIMRVADGLTLKARPSYEFIDRDLDRIMGVDGIEVGTVMAIELGETLDAR